MAFNSFEFIVYTLGIAAVYYLIPRKVRYIWLLVASVFFYSLWSVPNTLLLLASATVTYFCGMRCDMGAGDGQAPTAGNRKGWLVFGVLALVSELFVFKYLRFFLSQINAVFGWINPEWQRFPEVRLLMPIGISFYVFQSIGYLVDVYKGKIQAERNILRFLLFITFFPKIIQGPIERSDGFLRQINDIENRSRFEYRRINNGMIIALWGFFMKMVIADRIAIVVDQVFNTYYIYGTVELVFAAVAYAIQIYCDFAGYSAIAVGVARIFGFDLIQNFDVPYFSASTREFWRRWHVSLSTWFRDYVYIPLGGSQCSKWRKRLNIIIVMLVSGIWHGAGWTFIVWGLLHGIFQAASDALTPKLDDVKRRLRVHTESASYTIGRIIATFLLVDFAWIFFRAESVGIAVDFIRRIFCNFNPWTLFDGSLLKLGLDQVEMNVLSISMLILVVVDYIQYKKKIRLDQMLENQCLWFRWGVIILLFTLVWVCGKYGPMFNSSSFIYQSF